MGTPFDRPRHVGEDVGVTRGADVEVEDLELEIERAGQRGCCDGRSRQRYEGERGDEERCSDPFQHVVSPWRG